MDIEEVLSTPRSPWQRAYVERVIGSIRRECLDHLIVFNEASLRRALRSYFGLLSQIPNPSLVGQGLARAAADSTGGNGASRGSTPGRCTSPPLRTTSRLSHVPPPYYY